MNNVLFYGTLENTLITPNKQINLKIESSEVLVFPSKVQKLLDHTLITPSESDGLIFPGELQEEKSHTLISPLIPKYTNDYLEVDNALSELNTPELAAKARKNLGIDDNSYKWSVLEESYFIKDATLFVDAVVIDDKILISGKVKLGLLIL